MPKIEKKKEFKEALVNYNASVLFADDANLKAVCLANRSATLFNLKKFESAILALREAAKSAPSNGDVLVNLGITLIESGRAEKALGIMNVHNARVPGSAKGLNTAGVAMFHLGQLTQAVETFGQVGDDAVASENLAQLAPNQG